MDILGHIEPPFYKNDSEREKGALQYLDAVLPYLPDYTEFMLHDKLREYAASIESKEESKKITEVQDLVEKILEREHFVERIGTTYLIQLTAKGRELKKAGSLNTYLNKDKIDRMETLNDGQIKHQVLKFLKANRNRPYELDELVEEHAIDEDRLIQLLDEMDADGNIKMTDVSSEEELNYLIEIKNNGINAYAKSEYLKDKPTVPKKRFNHFARNHITNEWEFTGIEEFDYDYKVSNTMEDKYVPIDENTIPHTSIHFGNKYGDTHIQGDNNIVAPNSEIKDSFKKNEETPEQKQIAKESLIWTKRNLYVAVIAIVVGVIIYLLQQ